MNDYIQYWASLINEAEESDVNLNSKDCVLSGLQLVTLPAAKIPEEVKGNFNCSLNRITHLFNCPEKVGGTFDCSINRLSSLEGCPEHIGKSFNCRKNKIRSLKEGPKTVGWSYNCSKNDLHYLDGCPEKIMGNFICSDNPIVRFSNGPAYVGKDFIAENLAPGDGWEIMIGLPSYIGGEFKISGRSERKYPFAGYRSRWKFEMNHKQFSQFQIDAYLTYLKLPPSEKAKLTKNNRYCPTIEWLRSL